MSSNAEYFAANQRSWDEITPVHLRGSRDKYPIEEFKRGQCTLRPLERHEVGEVAGKRLLHLQCHFGMDTLSWARLGAKATGMDFSPAAIEAARSLAAEIGVAAEFVCCNLYDLREHLAGRFDIVYASYGAMVWLPDLREWARIIAHFLDDGRFLYVADGHPINSCIQQDESGASRAAGDYFAPRRAIANPESGPDYANPEYIQTSPEYNWSHTTAELLNSLIDAGLRIDFFREWPGYNVAPGPDGIWRETRDIPSQHPMIFSLKATKG